MKKTTELGLYFLSLPFVISAAIEFLPQWLSMPISVIAGLLWFGTLIQIFNHDFEKDKEKTDGPL